MTKLFRKIRYSLMWKNKKARYLTYAIGEIMLVIIGILIAIQLNEWTNDISKNKQKQKVLSALQVEFQSNLSQLDTVLFYNNKVLSAYPHAMGLIKSQNKDVSRQSLFDVTKNVSYIYSFNPINGALRSGISSGEVHLINNDRLIELLFSWEDIVKDSQEESLVQRNYQYDSKSLHEKYIRVGDLYRSVYRQTFPSKYPSDYLGLFKDVLFEDYVSYSFFFAQEYSNELDIIKINNLEILELINQELGNHESPTTHELSGKF